MMGDIVKKGYLHCYLKGVLMSKSWQKRWCVLHKGDQARLDLYEDEDTYIKTPDHRKTQQLSEKFIVTKERKHKGRENILQLTLEGKSTDQHKEGKSDQHKEGKSDHHKVYFYSSDCESDISDWLDALHIVASLNPIMERRNSMSSLTSEDTSFDENVLYDSADHPEVFPVTVVENEVSVRCNLNGNYDLHINNLNIALVSLSTGKAVYIWPFRYIRRYGRSKTNLQFEAGRKCTSGEGLFTFATKEGNTIFQSINVKLGLLKQREKLGSPTAPGPELPERRYTGSSIALKQSKTEKFSRSKSADVADAADPAFKTELANKIAKKPAVAKRPDIKPKPKPGVPAKPALQQKQSYEAVHTVDNSHGPGPVYDEPEVPQQAWKQRGENVISHIENYDSTSTCTDQTYANTEHPMLIRQGSVPETEVAINEDMEYDHINLKGNRPRPKPDSNLYGKLENQNNDRPLYTTDTEYQEAEEVDSNNQDGYAYVSRQVKPQPSTQQDESNFYDEIKK